MKIRNEKCKIIKFKINIFYLNLKNNGIFTVFITIFFHLFTYLVKIIKYAKKIIYKKNVTQT